MCVATSTRTALKAHSACLNVDSSARFITSRLNTWTATWTNSNSSTQLVGAMSLSHRLVAPRLDAGLESDARQFSRGSLGSRVRVGSGCQSDYEAHAALAAVGEK